jgi:hypothetical protein
VHATRAVHFALSLALGDAQVKEPPPQARARKRMADFKAQWFN